MVGQCALPAKLLVFSAYPISSNFHNCAVARNFNRYPFDLEVESVPPYCFPALHKRLRERLVDKLTADVQRCNKTVGLCFLYMADVCVTPAV